MRGKDVKEASWLLRKREKDVKEAPGSLGEEKEGPLRKEASLPPLGECASCSGFIPWFKAGFCPFLTFCSFSRFTVGEETHPSENHFLVKKVRNVKTVKRH